MASASVLPLLEHQKDHEERISERWWSKLIDVAEAKDQLFFAIPMILTNASYYGITLISVMFAGHLGDLDLAGATLAHSWATVTGLALMTGLSGALETLCGQGFGAKLYRMLGIYLQSSIITSLFFSIIISALWFYSENILVLLHQQPEIAKLSGLYLRYLIPGLFAYGFLQCMLRFLQTQTVVLPLLICSLVPLVLHVGVAYLLVHCTSLGFRGASLGASVSLWVSLIMLAAYINYSKKFQHTWVGLSLDAFTYVLPSLRLAIPSAIMVCLEYWAFELLVLIAGLMPNSENTTSVIAMCVNTETASYMITYGLSAAASTRASNELGAGNVAKAKNAMAVTLKLSILLALAVVLSLAIGHNTWASLFSDSSIIKKEFSSMAPFLAVSILLDSIQGVLSGVCRGCGLQHLAVWTNLAAFYILGMPASVLFGFKFRLYEKGLWMGLICGLACQAAALLAITLTTKWEKVDLTKSGETNQPLLL